MPPAVPAGPKSSRSARDAWSAGHGLHAVRCVRRSRNAGPCGGRVGARGRGIASGGRLGPGPVLWRRAPGPRPFVDARASVRAPSTGTGSSGSGGATSPWAGIAATTLRDLPEVSRRSRLPGTQSCIRTGSLVRSSGLRGRTAATVPTRPANQRTRRACGICCTRGRSERIAKGIGTGLAWIIRSGASEG